MSYMEMSNVRSLNDDAKLDAEVKFGDKETSKKFTTQGGIKDVNAVDQAADGVFMASATLVPVNQEEVGRSKRARKTTQKGLEYQISVLEEKCGTIQRYIQNV